MAPIVDLKIMNKIIIILITFIISSCHSDTPFGIQNKYSQSWGIDKYPSGMAVSKHCRNWHYYHYYRSYCKSQKCLDLYEKKKPVATIRSCQKRAASHGADTSNFLTEEEIEALELELRKDMCRHSGEWIKSDPTFCARHGIKKEAR
jgi:hypothetical protein